jgi:Fe2+ transport protein
MRTPRVGWCLAAAALVLVAVGCGSSGSSAGNTNLISVAPASSAASTGAGGTAPMNGMSMKAMPIRTLGSVNWQGMNIQARSMAPAKFVVVTGTHERLVTPTRKDSMHLMVVLTDALTHAPIPYSSVWATIRKGGKIVYDDRQWPMISRYMGVHYGNNVALPGAGNYTLSLLISPPQSARHMEYAHVWLKPHRVEFAFHWQPGS